MAIIGICIGENLLLGIGIGSVGICNPNPYKHRNIDNCFFKHCCYSIASLTVTLYQQSKGNIKNITTQPIQRDNEERQDVSYDMALELFCRIEIRPYRYIYVCVFTREQFDSHLITGVAFITKLSVFIAL